MKYTVVWQPSAENELIELWPAAANREQVTQAADEIERILSTKPTEAGESRSGDIRILIVPPLAANFRVFQADRIVRVSRVWEI
jgi:plasmid stabilization system protein ParE